MRWGRRLLMVAGAAGLLTLSGCGGNAVDHADLEREISTRLEAEVGVAPQSVDCPDDLDAEVGASARCVLTADDGSQIGVTVVVTEVVDSNVRFDIQVDDRVMS